MAWASGDSPPLRFSCLCGGAGQPFNRRGTKNAEEMAWASGDSPPLRFSCLCGGAGQPFNRRGTKSAEMSRHRSLKSLRLCAPRASAVDRGGLSTTEARRARRRDGLGLGGISASASPRVFAVERGSLSTAEARRTWRRWPGPGGNLRLCVPSCLRGRAGQPFNRRGTKSAKMSWGWRVGSFPSLRSSCLCGGRGRALSRRHEERGAGPAPIHTVPACFVGLVVDLLRSPRFGAASARADAHVLCLRAAFGRCIVG